MVMVVSGFVGVGKLLSVEAKLTEAVKGGLVIPVIFLDALENVSSLGTVGIEVEVTVATEEHVAAEALDGFDGFLDSHGWFVRSITIVTQKEEEVNT